MRTTFMVLVFVAFFVLLMPVINQLYAYCQCLEQTIQLEGTYDSAGDPIPKEAYGVWVSTPQEAPLQPLCLKSQQTYGKSIVSNPSEGMPCNIYTQNGLAPAYSQPITVPKLGEMMLYGYRMVTFIVIFVILFGSVKIVISLRKGLSSEEQKRNLKKDLLRNIFVLVGIGLFIALLMWIEGWTGQCLGITCTDFCYDCAGF